MKNENSWIVVLVVVLVIFILTGFTGMMPWGMMGGYWAGSLSFMWVFMILIWVLIVIFLILGIVWLAKQIQKR
ncbi:MAG: hypothetical protein KatS3mg001_020 [Candidatus Pacearchaeota archaeon]|nr:MAG: hypothetical protein KatS3mg001_020 [Candidatus Pacearchaeota archaeon]